MAELTKEQRLGEAVAIRTKMKANNALRKDVIDAIETALGKHGIALDPTLRSYVVVAVAEEISGQLSNVVLPGGTNC